MNDDWDAAYSDFSDTLSIAPRSTAARLNLALARERLGDTLQALEELERCLKIDADHPHALGNAARLAFELERFGEAVRHLSSLVVLYPKNPVVRLNRGLAFAQFGEVELAIAELQHPEVEQDSTPAVQRILASLLARQGRALESLETLRPVLDFAEVDPETQHASVLLAAGALGRLAGQDQQLGNEARGALRLLASKSLPIESVADWSAELESLERSFQSTEYCAISPLDFATLDTTVANRSPGVAQDSFLEALKLIQSADLFAARAALTRCLRIEPQHASARKRRAVIQLDIGEYAAAIADVDFLLAQTPDDPELWTVRATAAARSKQFDSAIAALDHAVRLEQKNPVVYANRALTRFASKSNPELTITDIERAERLGLVTAELIHIKAAAYMQLDEYEEALNLQQEVIKMEPQNPTFLVQRAKLYRLLGDNEHSIEDAKAAVELDEQNLDANVELARAHLFFEDWSALNHATDRIAQLGWKDDELHSMRQRAFEATNNYDGLVELLSARPFETLTVDQQSLLVGAELRTDALDAGIAHAMELVEQDACPEQLMELAAELAIDNDLAVESHVLLGRLLRDHDPQRTEYYMQMADCCQNIGAYPESLLWLAKYLERVPDSSRAWEMTGDAMATQRTNRVNALKCYSEALKFEPDNRSALLSRAKLLVDVGKFDLAKLDLKRLATASNPPDDVAELLRLCDQRLLASQPAL